MKIPAVRDGVTLFFVISGFLITYLLLNEKGQKTDVHVPKFYLRRILRIWPLYFLYLAIALTYSHNWADPNIWYYLLFLANIPIALGIGILPIAHYWSISVEEQFYLFWPWIVKKWGGYKKLTYISISVLLIWVLTKWGLFLFAGKCDAYRFFQCSRFDCMMIGSIGAILYFTKSKFLFKVINCRWLGMICLLLIAFSQPWADIIPAPARPQALALLSLFAIFGQLGDTPIISLENRLFDHVGKISYGIYIIHPLLIFLFSNVYPYLGITLNDIWLSILYYCVITISTIAIAWLSYRYIESPFLRLKNRFAIVQSQSSMK